MYGKVEYPEIGFQIIYTEMAMFRFRSILRYEIFFLVVVCKIHHTFPKVC